MASYPVVPGRTEWSDRHPDKDRLRADIWLRLQQTGVAIRDPVGHIPNFIGAEQAAERLATLPVWQQATVVKCNPDSPQMAVRLRALQEGKRLYMAVPRLTQKQCFVELSDQILQHKAVSLQQAATMKTALKVGRFVSFEEMEPIDLVVVGCVAASRQGGRTGKGAGFADLELAMLRDLRVNKVPIFGRGGGRRPPPLPKMGTLFSCKSLREFGLVQATTPIVTTVHSLQLVEAAKLPMQPHDWPVDWIATPDEVIETHSTHPKPPGLDWNAIRPDQYQSIPILRQLRPSQSSDVPM